MLAMENTQFTSVMRLRVSVCEKKPLAARQVHFPFGWIVMIAWIMFGACAATLSANGYAFETGRVYSARYSPHQYKNEDGNVLVFDNDLLDRLFGKDRAEKGSNNVDRPSRDATLPTVPTWTDSPRVLPNQSLLAAISVNTNSRRAAALRFTEKGRTLIQQRDYLKALSYLEKALDLDGSPFVYFYLARVHYYLGDYPRALGFVEVAESRLYQQSEWTEALAALRSAVSAPPMKQTTITKQNIARNYTEY
jgi:tetratricopeptide (TPR) repeat protein